MTDGAAEERHEFQTETKKLLDLMINSLYSNREIFLRELVSNASDALDKLRFAGVTNDELLPDGDLHVFLEVDAEARTLKVIDNGIGMSRDEVRQNLGTIAKSGTRELHAALADHDGEVPPEFIGQFGVGFYSSFLVADRVEVVTRRAGEETATRWQSEGDGNFVIGDAERREAGTTITLHLKPVDEDDGIEDYTDKWVLRRLITRYSDFVAYPIRMEAEIQEPALGADGKPIPDAPPVIKHQIDTLNSMEAIWTKDSADVDDHEYEEFYKHITHDWNEPLERLRTKIEGTFEAQALLFIPSKAPFDLYHREMNRRGIQLYVKRVFIMDECRELIPDYLRFVRGVVDAEDLSLNVSRELLQRDRQIIALRKHLVKKVLGTLEEMKANDRAKYREFWAEFGPVIKEGVLDPKSNTETLLSLVLAHTSTDDEEMISLDEYIERMPEDQEVIYYLTAATLESARRSPHLEAFKERGIEVLLLGDHVDEVWVQIALTYKGKKLQSVGKGEVELGDDEERKRAAEVREEKEGELKGLLATMRAAVQDDIKEVRLSSRLISSAVCLVTEEGGITPQMEWLMRQSGQKFPKIKRILELNPKHPVMAKLEGLHAANADDGKIREYAILLYGQAVLAEGGQIEEPAEFARLIAEVMARAT